MYMNIITTVCVVMALASGTLAQELPTERPAGCDGSSCVGCTPFVPKPGKATDYPCGQVDVYFPVPIYVIRNDTSAKRELISRQWACFACCTLGCGFDDPQNTCAYTEYQYEENGKYGCTKCKGKDAYVEGGSVKLSFEDLSTSSVYSVINQPYGACIDKSDIAEPNPPENPPPVQPEPTPSPTPTPTPSPSPSPTPTPSPPVEEEVKEEPTPSPPVEEVKEEVVEEEKAIAPEAFVPLDIGSTTPSPSGEGSSSGAMVPAGVVMLVLGATASVLL